MSCSWNSARACACDTIYRATVHQAFEKAQTGARCFGWHSRCCSRGSVCPRRSALRSRSSRRSQSDRCRDRDRIADTQKSLEARVGPYASPAWCDTRFGRLKMLRFDALTCGGATNAVGDPPSFYLVYVSRSRAGAPSAPWPAACGGRSSRARPRATSNNLRNV
jgi:hypothetical protein